MSDVQELILTEIKTMRKESRADIKDLHKKIDKNHVEQTEKFHDLDKKVLGNKLKLGMVFTGITLVWGLIIKFAL